MQSLLAMPQDSTSTVQKTVQYDYNTSQPVLHFDMETIEELKSDEDFNYIEIEQTENLWTRFKNWVNQLWSQLIEWLFGVTEIKGFWGTVLSLLPYLIIVGILFLIGWLFMKVNPKDMLLESQTLPSVLLTEDEEIIQNQNIDQLIAKTLEQKNYRLAIRYYYLKALKQLTDKDLIDWQSQKTNMDYYRELPNHEIQQQFQVITKLYDFIWYGGFEVDQNTYLQAEKEFKNIHHLIQS